MKTDLLTPFERIPYFTIEGFKQSSGMDRPAILLHRWAKAGKILSLKKGVYMTRRYYELHARDGGFTEAVSAILFPNSYLSIEFVLQQNNLLTEATYPVTCITPRNTRRISNSLGEFWYRNIRADLFCGFSPYEYKGIRFFRASMAKALFDYLYLRPIPAAYRGATTDLAEEFRLNLDEVPSEDQKEFAHYVETSRSLKMMDVLKNFRRTVWKT